MDIIRIGLKTFIIILITFSFQLKAEELPKLPDEHEMNFYSGVFDFSDNDFTVAFHLKRDEIVGVARLFGNAVNEGCGTDQWSSRFWVELRSEGTANHLQVISSGAGSYNTGVIIDDLDWHHLIIMRDNDSLYVYYDHVLSFTTSFAGTIVSHCADFQIGTNLSLGNGIDGQMDDFAIWNRAITEQERIALQNPGISLVDGLVGYWNFNEGSGTTFADQTSNGNNGTIVNATWNNEANVVVSYTPNANYNGSDSFTYTEILIQNHFDRAVKSLERFSDNDVRGHLFALSEYITKRKT